MTTLALTDLDSRSSAKGLPMKRIGNVFRLHFVTPSTLVVLPWIIMAIIFLANMAIWYVISASTGKPLAENFSSSTSWMFVYMMVVAIQAVTLTFPYALGMSVTRREYSLGSGLAFLAVSVANAVIFTVLSYLEQWTGGWGVNGHLFALEYVTDGSLLQRLLVYFVGFAFFFSIGWVAAATWVRWRAFGLTTLGLCFAVVLIGVALLITWLGAWPNVAEWFVASGSLGVAAWLLVPTVIAAFGGFLLLRRATPRG